MTELDWKLYTIEPIEFNWIFCRSVEDTLATISNPIFHSNIPLCPIPEDFKKDWETAQKLARENNWDGSFKFGPVVFWIPDSGTFTYGFAFTGNEEDTTYVVSPVEMAHFE